MKNKEIEVGSYVLITEGEYKGNIGIVHRGLSLKTIKEPDRRFIIIFMYKDPVEFVHLIKYKEYYESALRVLDVEAILNKNPYEGVYFTDKEIVNPLKVGDYVIINTGEFLGYLGIVIEVDDTPGIGNEIRQCTVEIYSAGIKSSFLMGELTLFKQESAINFTKTRKYEGKYFPAWRGDCSQFKVGGMVIVTEGEYVGQAAIVEEVHESEDCNYKWYCLIRLMTTNIKVIVFENRLMPVEKSMIQTKDTTNNDVIPDVYKTAIDEIHELYTDTKELMKPKDTSNDVMEDPDANKPMSDNRDILRVYNGIIDSVFDFTEFYIDDLKLNDNETLMNLITLKTLTKIAFATNEINMKFKEIKSLINDYYDSIE
jgi:transcription antitermination factor NusG